MHLKGRTVARCEFFREVEFGALACVVERCAILELKTTCLYGFQHACLFHKSHALRQQALADRKSRELLLFQHQDFITLLDQQSRGDRARRACTYDQDIHGGRCVVDSIVCLHGWAVSDNIMTVSRSNRQTAAAACRFGRYLFRLLLAIYCWMRK